MNTLNGEFEALKINNTGSVDDYYNQVMVLVNPLKSNGKDFSEFMKKIRVVVNPLKSNGKNIVEVMKFIM